MHVLPLGIFSLQPMIFSLQPFDSDENLYEHAYDHLDEHSYEHLYEHSYEHLKEHSYMNNYII